MEVVIILLIVGASVWGIISAINDSEKQKENKAYLETEIDKMSYFTASQKIMGVKSEFLFAIDNNRKKIIHMTPKKKRIISYEDIMSVELLEDNTTIASRSLGRTVGGAVVGGALAGGAGSVVGGLSGNQTMKKKVSFVKVKITVRDINQPTEEIVCFNARDVTMGEDSIKSDSMNGNLYYKPGLEKASKITDMVRIIIDEVERNTTTNNNSLQSSIADELSKLADLKAKGILTEEEFAAQKTKLLG